MNLTSLSLFQLKKRLVTAGPHLAKAVAAIDRSAFAGLKGYFRLLTTLGANRGIHLAGFPAAGTHSLGFPCLTAGGAALGLIGKALLGVKLLLSGGEGERSLAIRTGKGLVREAQG